MFTKLIIYRISESWQPDLFPTLGGDGRTDLGLLPYRSSASPK